MAFGKDMDAWAGDTGLSLVERNEKKSRFSVSWAEAKLLTIAGVGFLMDAWDLFIINIIYSIILLAYYTNPRTKKTAKNIDWGLEGGVLKASANIGNIIGQLFFGFCGDMFGRSAVYGKELFIVIIGVILQISAPDSLGGKGITIWLTGFRILMGIGIGGDYPMSATIVSDRSHLKNRGFMLSWIFSNQGWGNLVGALFAVIVIRGYRHYVDAGDFHKLSGAWRILQGLTLIPAFIVLYFRLTLVESTRFAQARKLQDDPELIAKGHTDLKRSPSDEEDLKEKAFAGDMTPIENTAVGMSFKSVGKPKNEFIEYFSEWKNAKTLIGCAASWFLVDITFYGIGLNQSAILSAIGFTTGSPWGKLMKTATGNLIITAAGFLPGYYFTMFTVDIVGRKPIQLIGFLANALFLGILAGRFDHLKHQTGPFFVVFVFLQLSFNFGPNATTFIIPAEVFPTRVRATAHGFCAACGKCGAILSSLLFSHLASKTSLGNQGVFWIFFGVSILGAIVTYFFVPETNGYDADEEDRKELARKAGVQ